MVTRQLISAPLARRPDLGRGIPDNPRVPVVEPIGVRAGVLPDGMGKAKVELGEIHADDGVGLALQCELEELADKYEQFKALNTEIISLSTDTAFVHKAWHDHSPAIKKIMFPMGADTNGNITRGLGVYLPAEGLALRGTFIIDPDGIMQAYEVNSNNIGRSAAELLRKLQAAQFVREHHGEVCPASWHPGAKTLTPGLDLVGKL